MEYVMSFEEYILENGKDHDVRNVTLAMLPIAAGATILGAGAAIGIGAYRNNSLDKKIFTSGTESQKKARTQWYNSRKGTHYTTSELEHKFKK